MISHDIEKDCSKIPGLKKEKLELLKGVVHADLFKKICEKKGKEEKVIKRYLLALKLGVELKDSQIFIPAIVSGGNKVR